MKGSEEAIEKVLAGLRDAEAPEGMERRILDALENGEPVRAGSVWHRLLPLWLLAPVGAMTRVLVCGAALAGVVVVVFAASAIRHAGSSPVQSKKEVAPEKLSPAPPSVVDAPSVAASLSRKGRAGLRVRSAVGETQSVRTVDSEDSVALSEMRAASFPAPPMPLTEQERLLLRIAHKGDPVEVALLDPNQRNLQEMKEKAEYQSFFARHAIEQPATGQMTPEQAVPASDPAEEKQLEGQQQIPSGEGNKNGNDNSKNKDKGETE
jgi:hypothetical protein